MRICSSRSSAGGTGGGFGVEVSTFLGLELHGDVLESLPLPAPLTHQAAKQDAEIPVVEPKAEEQQAELTNELRTTPGISSLFRVSPIR